MTTTTIKGTRADVEPHLMTPGEFGRWCGVWYARPPSGSSGIANLSKHEIVEHKDGSITVKPSIELRVMRTAGGFTRWHGYLQAGRWLEIG